MAALVSLQAMGNQIVAIFDDGTRKIAYPTQGGLWVVGGSSVTPPPPPPPPTGTGVLIYPTYQHTVVDFDGSFNGHRSRTPPSVNPGSDYAVPVGTDVHAVHDGIVTNADSSPDGGGGRTVHIDHPDLGTGSDYLHNSVILCSAGQTVKQGDVIAKSGGSGFGQNLYYGPHCHISYRNALGHAYTYFNSVDFDALIKAQG